MASYREKVRADLERWIAGGLVAADKRAPILATLPEPRRIDAATALASASVAAAMAIGAIDNSNAHVTLATTGIAGPTGAVQGKPVGTVCFGWAVVDKQHGQHITHTERLVFGGDRHAVREQTVKHALQGLLRFLG